MFFFFKGMGVPLDLFVLLGRKGNPRSEQGFSFLPKTHLPFLALPKGSALWNPGLVLRRGGFDQSFYARLHSKRGWAGTPLNLSKYVLCRPTKLGADGIPNYICRTKFILSASHRSGQSPCTERGSTPAPSEAVPLHRARQYLCTERGSTPAPNEVCTRTRTRRICYPFPASSPPCKDSCT